MKVFKTITDSFQNILKSLGTSKDPRQNTKFVPGMFIDQATANWLYVYNWLAARVVDAPIDDATSKWRTLLIPDADKKEHVEKVMASYHLKEVLNIAMKWARVFGGSAIVIIIENEDQESPLVVENIKPGSLTNLIPLDRYNIFPEVVNRDILSVNYGKPEFYTVVRDGQRIHHTRIVKFQGTTSTMFEFERNNFWGNSIFTRLWEPIMDSQVVSSSINTLVYEANIDVYKLNGLNDLAAEKKDNLAVERIRLLHEMKSIVNGIVIDKEDDFEKRSNTFTQLPEIDDRSFQKVSGASGIPNTKLLGTSPAGQDATGKSDMNNYYDLIIDKQENEIRPPLDYLDSSVAKSAGIEPFEYKFDELEVPSESEQSAIDVANSNRDQKYYDMGAIITSDVMTSLLENGTYPSMTTERIEEQKKIEEEEKEDFNFGSEEENPNGIPTETPEGAGGGVPEAAEEVGEGNGEGD